MKSIACRMLTAASAAMLWSAESPAHAGQSGNTYYVTGPNQDLTGSINPDVLGFACHFPSTVMDVDEAKSLPDNLILSGTWTGGDSFDEYFLCDGDIPVSVYSPTSNGMGMTLLYERPTPIHVSFDLDNLHIIDSGFNRLFMIHQGNDRLDMQGKRYDVPDGIMHLVFDNIDNFQIAGGAKNDTVQTTTSSKNIEVHGQGGDDFIIVQGDDNNLYGDEGNDTLSGQGGMDENVTTGSTFFGGLGDDNYMVFRAIDRLVENPGEGFDTLYIYDKDYQLTSENSANMERVVLTSDMDDE